MHPARLYLTGNTFGLHPEPRRMHEDQVGSPARAGMHLVNGEVDRHVGRSGSAAIISARRLSRSRMSASIRAKRRLARRRSMASSSPNLPPAQPEPLNLLLRGDAAKVKQTAKE